MSRKRRRSRSSRSSGLGKSVLNRLAVMGIGFFFAPKIFQWIQPFRDQIFPPTASNPTPIPPAIGANPGTLLDTGSLTTTTPVEQPITAITDGVAPTGVSPLTSNPNELAPVAGPTGGLFLNAILLGVLLAAQAVAAPRSVTFKSVIGPATSTANVSLSSGTSANPARNCVSNLTVTSGGGLLQMLSGGNTTYAVDLGTGTPFNKYWGPDDPWCAAISTTTTIKVTGSNGTFRLSYQGYTY